MHELRLMKALLIAIIFFFFSCIDKTNEKVASKDQTQLEEQFHELKDVIAEKENKLIPLLNGRWKLKNINAPWAIEVPISKDEIWSFETEGLITISQNATTKKLVEYTLRRTISAFSSDSVLTIHANFNDSRIITDLEIWINDNQMKLIGQCDDCYSFEFEKLDK